jgi:HSP20 family protein
MADLMVRSPFDILRQTQQMLSRLDPMFGQTAYADSEEEGTLALDIYEANDELVVEASVPGFRREDIAIQLHQGLLSIVARHAALNGAEGYADRRYYRRERAVGAWTRRIALPGIVHDAEVKAELKDGVLRLRIPVPESAKPRQIAIQGDGANSEQWASSRAEATVGTGEGDGARN